MGGDHAIGSIPSAPPASLCPSHPLPGPHAQSPRAGPRRPTSLAATSPPLRWIFWSTRCAQPASQRLAMWPFCFFGCSPPGMCVQCTMRAPAPAWPSAAAPAMHRVNQPAADMHTGKREVPEVRGLHAWTKDSLTKPVQNQCQAAPAYTTASLAQRARRWTAGTRPRSSPSWRAGPRPSPGEQPLPGACPAPHSPLL